MIVSINTKIPDIQAAVAIVGAGPAGLSLALTLARAGIDTVIVESGDVHADVSAASLASAADISPKNHAPLEWATHRRVGGASWTWGGRCVDIDPIDFEIQPGAEAPGWPITYEDATAEAVAAATFLDIGKPQFDTQLDCLGSESLLYARLERWCGDPRLARRHAVEIRTSTKVRVFTGLTCTAIAVDADKRRALGIRAKHRSGSDHFISARHYVLAAGGIETTRLLLASTTATPSKVLSSSPWLGRGYMGHFDGTLADIVLDRLSEDEIDYTLDEKLCYVRRRLMLRPDVIRQNGLLNIAFFFGNPPLGNWRHRSGALSAAALALYTPFVGRILQPGPIRNILLGQPPTATALQHHLRNTVSDGAGTIAFAAHTLARRLKRPQVPGMFVRNRARRYSLKYVSEQSPSFASRIWLSDHRDRLGLPKVNIDKAISDVDVESILKAHDLLDVELRRLKLGRLEYLSPPADRAAMAAGHGADGYHQIGLTRMGSDYRSSVVNADCTLHGVRNIHIASSAVFSTSGQANPTFLIVCLALRLAKRLISELRD